MVAKYVGKEANTYRNTSIWVSKFLVTNMQGPKSNWDLNQATKSVLQAYSSGGSSWVLDSGCTNHMTGERSMFSSYSPMTHSNKNIVFGDNSKGDMIGLGKVAITLEHSITIVLHIDSLSYNLLSVVDVLSCHRLVNF